MMLPIRGRTMAQMNRPGWSAFGLSRTDSAGGKHNGFDLYAPEGTPIYGTSSGGVVSKVYFDSGNLGWVTEIDYPAYTTQDCHQPERPPINAGDPVGISTVVGHVGHTGNAADVVWYTDEGELRHDHHVVWIGDARVDPIAFYGASALAGLGQSVQQSEEREFDMGLQVFIDSSKFDSGGNRTKKTPFAIAGAYPGGGEANWREFPDGAGATFKTPGDPYYLAAEKLPVFDLDSEEYKRQRALFVAPIQITGGAASDGSTLPSLEDPAVLVTLQEIAATLKALPAQIDQYADGRKQG